MARPYKGTSFWDRVWSNARVLENGCVEFIGHKNECGYGRIQKDGKLVMVHREVYKALNPDEELSGVVMHSCDNPACINWEHLSHGTQADNIADMVSKGRRVVVQGSKQASSKLKESDIPTIRLQLRNGHSCYALAKIYGVSETMVRNIRDNKNWSHVK